MLCVQNGRHCNFKQVHFYSVFLSICYIAQNQCVFLKGFTMVFTRFTCFKLHCLLLPFWIPVKKNLGVCPHQLQTVSSGVLGGKLCKKCLTCSIWYRFFLSYPIIAMLLSEVNLGPDPASVKVEGSRIASFIMSVSYTGLAVHPVFFSVYR